MLQTHDLLPLFTATNDDDGTSFAYRDVWQRKHLLLVSAPRDDATREPYLATLRSQAAALHADDDVQLVITPDAIAGLPSPGVAVADRWGDIYFVAGAGRVASLPSPAELIQWITYVRIECPECQGEAH